MLEQLAAKLGKGLFMVSTEVGRILADAIDKAIDNVCDYIEKEKGVDYDHM